MGGPIWVTIHRVIEAYGLMMDLTEANQLEAGRRVEAHLAGISGDDKALAIEGLRYLRKH
ncbi:hypothetical protein ACE103_30045 [Bradyrhizobium sp. ma5]|uniref:hypothetical protein n=1 Tax=Bradyrhizobium sp. ma5 TaxID=3344828 RepID=UPI0035D4774A